MADGVCSRIANVQIMRNFLVRSKMQSFTNSDIHPNHVALFSTVHFLGAPSAGVYLDCIVDLQIGAIW